MGHLALLLALLPARIERIPTVEVEANVLEMNIIEPQVNGLGFGPQGFNYQAIAWEWANGWVPVDHAWADKDWTRWQTKRKQLLLFREGKVWRIRFNSGIRTWTQQWGRFWDNQDDECRQRIFP